MAEYEDETKNLPLGSQVLVRFNYCDEEGEVVEEKQFFGLVQQVTKDEVIIKNPNNGKEVSLPPMFGSYIKAARGKYELPSTGETIMDPDYITEWTLRASSGK